MKFPNFSKDVENAMIKDFMSIIEKYPFPVQLIIQSMIKKINLDKHIRLKIINEKLAKIDKDELKTLLEKKIISEIFVKDWFFTCMYD